MLKKTEYISKKPLAQNLCTILSPLRSNLPVQRVLAPDAAILRRREMEDRLNTAKTFIQACQLSTNPFSHKQSLDLPTCTPLATPPKPR